MEAVVVVAAVLKVAATKWIYCPDAGKLGTGGEQEIARGL